MAITSSALQKKRRSKARLRVLTALNVGLAGLITSSGTNAADEIPSSQTELKTTLPVISVTGRDPAELDTQSGGRVAKRSTSASKTAAAIVETPYSLSVVTAAEMETRGVSSVEEAIRYVPGVLTQTYGYDDRGYEWFTIRGFDNLSSASYLDGLRQPAASFLSAQNEPFGLERIEVLRGPSSVMYGQGDAGGVVARVSKRPRADQEQVVRAQVGTLGRREIAADLGGRANEDGSVLYRVVALTRDSRPQNDFPGFRERSTRRVYFAPSMTWKASDATSVTVLSHFLDVKATTNHTEYLGPKQTRSGVLLGEPSFDAYNHQQWGVGYEVEHKLGADWGVRQNARVANTKLNTAFVYGWGVESAGVDGDVSRFAERHLQGMSHVAIDNQLHGKFDLGWSQHSAVVGLDFLRSKFKTLGMSDNAPGLNILRPIYGQRILEPASVTTDLDRTQRQVGLYFQDQIKVAQQWRLDVGLRRDMVRTGTADRLSPGKAEEKDSATTKRLGLTYVANSGVAPYASYTESFLAQSGTDFQGSRFDPSKGKQYEVGVKYQPKNGSGLMSAALFDLTKSNVKTTDPMHPGFSIQTGEIRSRGVEFEIKQRIAKALNVSLQYTVNDVEVTRSTEENFGKRPVNIPRNLASAWMDYDLPKVGTGRLKVGAGIRYVGKRFADSINTITTPAHTLVDASVTYDLNSWQFAMHATNLFDKAYPGTFAYGYYPGAKRTVNLTAALRF